VNISRLLLSLLNHAGRYSTITLLCLGLLLLSGAAMVWPALPAWFVVAVCLLLAVGMGRAIYQLQVGLDRAVQANQELEHLARDRTGQLRAALEQLHELDRFKSQIFRVIGHELRSPLYTVIGYLQVMQTPAAEALYGHRVPRLLADLGGLHDTCIDLARIVENVFDFVKIEDGRFALTTDPFDLRQLAADMVAEYTRQAAASSSTIRLEPSRDEPVQICGDAGRVTRVLRNLVSNAVKHTHHGEIVIQIRRDASRPVINLTVKDTGSGVPLDDQRIIFTPFEIAQGRGTGVGLGLPVSKRVVETHGGRVWLESSPAQGTRVTVELPIDCGSAPSL
jgi:two-component system, NarL family, sensor histidine kinase EvgS